MWLKFLSMFSEGFIWEQIDADAVLWRFEFYFDGYGIVKTAQFFGYTGY